MTVTPAALDRSALSAAVLDRLAAVVRGVTADTVYLGEPPTSVPTDRDGYAVKYLAVYPSPGTPSLEQDMGQTAVDLDWVVQITCAGGWVQDVEELTTDVHAALYRWAPTVDGLVCGPLAPPPGFDPGPIRYDRDATPHRPYLPLQYRTTVTAT